MAALRIFSLASFLALTMTGLSYGQAMIGYGINVGRAGAAGAAAGAAGAGAAGIFQKLRRNANQASTGKSGTRRASRQPQPEFEDTDLRVGTAKPAYQSSQTVKTSSGVTISGLTPSGAAQFHATYGEPSGPKRAWKRRLERKREEHRRAVLDAARAASNGAATGAGADAAGATGAGADETGSAPAAETSEPAGLVPVGETAAGGAAAGAETVAATPAAPSASAPGQSVTASSRVSIGEPMTAKSSRTPEGEHTPRLLGEDDRALVDELADIEEGLSIEDLIERFGKPIVQMMGLVADGYSAKYVFRTASGRRFTVFAYEGKVMDVVAEPLLVSRAAR